MRISLHNMLFHYPTQATVNSPVSKSKIYQHSQPPRPIRQRFTDQVQRIIWAYKLAPTTLNLPASDDIEEIQIFHLDLKTPQLDDSVLKTLDQFIHFPILFELHYQGRIKSVIAHKRRNQTQAHKAIIDRYYSSDWQPADQPRQPLPAAIDLDTLYQQLLRAHLPLPARDGESLAAQSQRLGLIEQKQKEYGKLAARLKREAQFKRKVAINAELRDLKARIDQLTQP